MKEESVLELQRMKKVQQMEVNRLQRYNEMLRMHVSYTFLDCLMKFTSLYHLINHLHVNKKLY
jgi:hypothetical protein